MTAVELDGAPQPAQSVDGQDKSCHIGVS